MPRDGWFDDGHPDPAGDNAPCPCHLPPPPCRGSAPDADRRRARIAIEICAFFDLWI